MKKQTLSSPAAKKGQSLVEFAISLTFMLILLAGTVDFGIGLFHYIAMQDAAQEGALYGSINPPPNAGRWKCPNPNIANICARLANTSGGDGIIKNIYDSGMTAAITVSGRACEGNALTVTLLYEYPLSMPFIGTLIGSDHIQLRATATDTILTPPCP
jgi:Flp pilus assembly protein TadG